MPGAADLPSRPR